MQQVSQIDVSQTTLKTDCVRRVKNGKRRSGDVKWRDWKVVCGSSQKRCWMFLEKKRLFGLKKWRMGKKELFEWKID